MPGQLSFLFAKALKGHVLELNFPGSLYTQLPGQSNKYLFLPNPSPSLSIWGQAFHRTKDLVLKTRKGLGGKGWEDRMALGDSLSFFKGREPLRAEPRDSVAFESNLLMARALNSRESYFSLG